LSSENANETLNNVAAKKRMAEVRTRIGASY
jgi:hypothetical protein